MQARNGRGEFSFFSFLMSPYVWRPRQEKKILNLPSSVPRPRICGDWKGNNSNPGIRRPSIRGSFMDDRRWHSDFWPGPAVTIPRSLGPGFFHIFFFDQNVNGHTTVSQTGFFLIPFLTWDIRDHTTDAICETRVWSLPSQSKLSKKNPVWLTVVWPLALKKNPVCETVIWPVTFGCKLR